MSARPSIVQRLPAWLKLLVAVGIVLSASLLPRSAGIWLVVPAGFLLVVMLLARLEWWTVGKRLLWLEPFVLGVALMALFSGGGWEARWWQFGFLVGRCTVALLAMLLFTAVTPFADILRLFQRLRVPGLLVTTLALMHRYLYVLADESGRMRRARASRTFSGGGRRMGWRTLSTVVAQLFVRASDRADRIYDAMRARGWNAD